jgi:uncharacterized sodium:solute symporter family permease YidK
MVDKLVTTMSGKFYYDVRDEDAMTSDSNSSVATQQSIKAYADALTVPEKVFVVGEIADISSGASSWVIAPVAGTISKIYTVIDGAIITVDAGISFEIATVAVTGGGITIAFTGSAAGTVDSATPTAANVVTAGQAIEIITDGASTNAVKAVVTFEITV